MVHIQETCALLGVLRSYLIKYFTRHKCLSRPYPFKFFKGCLSQILLGPFLNTLSQILSRDMIIFSIFQPFSRSGLCYFNVTLVTSFSLQIHCCKYEKTRPALMVGSSVVSCGNENTEIYTGNLLQVFIFVRFIFNYHQLVNTSWNNNS